VRRARDIVGLPVICTKTGKKAGTVYDLLIVDDWRIASFILSPRNLFTPCRIMNWDDAVSCGEDAVTIEDPGLIRTVATASHSKRSLSSTTWKELRSSVTLVDGKRKVRGLPIVTTDGLQIGFVEDVYLRKDMGNTIIGFELSEGFISDLTEGRKWLSLPKTAIAGKDAIVVPAHCEEAVAPFFSGS
jgi:uncharacterized protein YrrD